MDLNDISGIGLLAIDAAAPAGSDVRQELAFDLLQNEISKMSNPAASSAVDWTQVVMHASALTREKGKDIMVMCYLAGGLLHTQGLPGLAAGLHVLDDALCHYWDGMYPPASRLRARRNALQWLMDRIKLHSEENDWSAQSPLAPSVVQALQTHLQSIDALMAQKDDDAPSLRPLMAMVATLPVQAQAEPEPEPSVPVVSTASAPLPDTAAEAVSASTAAAPAPVAPAPPTAATSAAPPAFSSSIALTQQPLESMEAIEEAATQVMQRLSDMAQWLIDADLRQPPLYRYNRMGAWGGMEQLPQANAGKTHLPGPVPQVLEALGAMQARQADEDLLRFAEAQLPIFPFWLDLNCMAAQALARLGPEYEAAKLEVQGATAWLVMRLPGIESLAFANDVPFASADTQQWLQTLRGSEGGGGAVQVDPLQTTVAKARGMAADGDVVAASQLLQHAISQATVPLQRFQLRTQLCELLFAQRPGANLLPFARMLVADIEKFQLTQWDPSTAAAGLRAAWQIIASEDERKAEADALLIQLAHIDAEAAVRLVTT